MFKISALLQKEAAPPPLPPRRVDPSFRRYWHVFPVIHPPTQSRSLPLSLSLTSEFLEAKVCHLQHPSGVDEAITRAQIAVVKDVTLVQV